MATVDDRLLSPDEAADYLGVSLSTLSNWRVQRKGPSFVKVGGGIRGRVRYRESALSAFFRDVGTSDQPVSPVGDTRKGGARQ